MTDSEPLPPATAEAFLDQLLAAGAGGAPVAWPPELAGPVPLGAAYALQDRHLQRLLARLGGEVVGLKLGMTTPEAQRALGLDAPTLGPLVSARRHDTPARLARADFRVCAIECEIAVRLGRDLPPQGTLRSRDELLAAIDAVFPSIEVADTRLANFAQAPVAAILADLGFAGAWVQGAPAPHWRQLDLRSLAVTLRADGAVVREGSAAAVLGDPLHALALAVADCGRRGRALPAGTLVTTGACTAPWPAPGPCELRADFGGLGQVALTLA